MAGRSFAKPLRIFYLLNIFNEKIMLCNLDANACIFHVVLKTIKVSAKTILIIMLQLNNGLFCKVKNFIIRYHTTFFLQKAISRSKSRKLQFYVMFIGQLTRWHDWNHCKWIWSKYLENDGNKTTALFYWWMPYLMTHYSVITWQLSSLMRAEVHQSKRVPLSYFSTQYSNSFFCF